MHLESGLDTCSRRGSVFFGSDRWGLFEDRGVRKGAPVYLYESLRPVAAPPSVTYQATYVRMYRHEDLDSEARKRRPATTAGPREGTFVVYWDVPDLRPLQDEEPFPISDLSTEDGQHLSLAFVPHGPLAISG
jgi:hypothetical protein